MFSKKIATSIFALLGSASAVAIPNNDGFPSPNADQLVSIAKQAGGSLPNVALPDHLGAASKTTFQLIAFNELFESAFFDSLLKNVTNGVEGFVIGNHNDKLIKILTTIRAQEEQHLLAAETALKTANAFMPTACQYQFPTKDLASAINLAETFTAVVLGALQGAAVNFAKDEFFLGVQLIASVIGQEGEQNGFYRHLIKQVPSESPFLTPVPAPFAFSALQNFVIPGSCPFPLSNIQLPIFPTLTVNGGAIAAIEPKNQVLKFSADLAKSEEGKKLAGSDGSKLFLTYTSGQQKPTSVALTNVKWTGTTINFDAEFPFDSSVMMGFTHASLTTKSCFESIDELVPATIAAPGFIQVENTSDCNKLADV